MKIIDVSEHQGIIDWVRVKPNIDGAIIRCGYGGDVVSQDDKFYKHNAHECERLGIPYGVYLYSYAKNIEMAKSEAKHALRLVEGRTLSLPIYFDAEQAGTENVAKANAVAFGDLIENEGYWCGLYANEYWFRHFLSGLDRFTKWVAKYGTNDGTMQKPPNVPGVDIWQYTSRGSVPGIHGNVDLNFCYRDLIGEILNADPVVFKTAIEIAKEVIDGKWGNGYSRKKRLKKAGYDYDEVQKIVNEIMREREV